MAQTYENEQMEEKVILIGVSEPKISLKIIVETLKRFQFMVRNQIPPHGKWQK